MLPAPSMPTIGSPLLWISFVVLVLVALALDLGLFHQKAHAPSFREALGWASLWSTLAALFGLFVGWQFGGRAMLEFYTGWVIELSLSIDNVFVFVVIFSTLHIPGHLQHRVLFWGVLTAMVLRAVMIVGGAALVARFDWILLVFGAFLVFTGVKLFFQRPHGVTPEESRMLGWLRRKLNVTRLHGQAFVVRVDGRRRATPLLLALLLVEISDVIFAVDSIPAIFAITTDPYLVFTSNVFAILGLRSLFFVLAGMVDKFRHLKMGLAIVLTFVGVKLLLQDVVHLHPAVSLAVVVGVLGTSVLVSLRPAGATTHSHRSGGAGA